MPACVRTKCSVLTSSIQSPATPESRQLTESHVIARDKTGFQGKSLLLIPHGGFETRTTQNRSLAESLLCGWPQTSHQRSSRKWIRLAQKYTSDFVSKLGGFTMLKMSGTVLLWIFFSIAREQELVGRWQAGRSRIAGAGVSIVWCRVTTAEYLAFAASWPKLTSFMHHSP